LKTTTLVGGAAALGTVASPYLAHAQAQSQAQALIPRRMPLTGMATTPS
jgi:hypothetical protein